MGGIGSRTLDVGDKRELLLDAAERTFCRLGYARTTIGELAADAGVTRPTIYAYFQSKDAVFAALADRIRQEFLTLQEEADTSSPAGIARSTLTAFLDTHVRHFGMLTILAHQAIVDPAMRELRAEIHGRATRRHTRFIERLVAQGHANPAIQPALVSEVVTGVVARFAEQAADDPRKQPALAEALVTLYIRLVGLT
ncbi:TetR family transcriptional regulator [Tamaricihabitans halophyticus]|uniref:TetR family transcriptional regulator n=1 Tax=Tamaricihabitans halophyticus TaxID=1262583 RepID=A0A4R2R529_9PSEU|nr:TetR/AcrR family transcriptional regulator [Tamaricihabitans halophyticus]TCP56899.1 TetR family transcriptional regulator [Tamaricihabitans halophyticus]